MVWKMFDMDLRLDRMKNTNIKSFAVAYNNYSYGHLLVITGYKWDYTFYKWGYKYL